MLRYFTTLFICSLLMASTSIAQDQNQILDAKGNLLLLKAENVGVQMTAQCKSFRVSKSPPLTPRLKCRFS